MNFTRTLPLVSLSGRSHESFSTLWLRPKNKALPGGLHWRPAISLAASPRSPHAPMKNWGD
jgi:hypothetical protein